MNRKLALSAITAIVLSFSAAVSLPAAAQDDNTTLGANTTLGGQEKPVFFDLGIDVTKLPQNPAEAKKYYAALDAQTQQIILASCTNYLKHPVDAAMPETLVFCGALITN